MNYDLIYIYILWYFYYSIKILFKNTILYWVLNNKTYIYHINGFILHMRKIISSLINASFTFSIKY